MSKLYLIDGMSVVFRAYHAMQRSGLQSADGEPTFAIYAFVNILTSLLEKEKIERIAVVFDRKEPTFRHEMYPLYKAHRDAFPDDLVPQLTRIKEFLDLAGFPRIELAGYEADDIIGTMTVRATKRDIESICLTSDKDFYQLVNDKVKLYKPGKPGEDFIVVEEAEVIEKFGVTPDKVIDMLALMGDSADNVPGVKGIGPKSAMPLVQEYGSVEGIYENIENITKPAIKKKLENDKEQAFLSKTLVTIKLDVPIEEKIDDCKMQSPDYSSLDQFFKKLGINQLRKRWNDKAVEAGIEELKDVVELQKTDTINDIEKDYQLIDTQEKLAGLLDYLADKKVLSVDLETSGLDRDKCEIVGIALSAEEGKAYYVAVDGSLGETIAPKQQDDLFSIPSEDNHFQLLPIQDVLDKLEPFMVDPEIGKCGQNIKFDIYILKRYGVEVRPIVFDSMIASYLINSDTQHNLDALSNEWLNYEPVKITSLIGEKKKDQKSMKDLDPKSISDYACEDADLALKLKNTLEKQLVKDELDKLGNEIEFPLIEVLNRMESNGIGIDEKALAELSEEITIEAKRLTEEIFKEAGVEFNIDSPKQLAHVLFEKMMIPPMKKTKTGYSTDVQVLTTLADTYPIADMILQYRQLAKLQSTYVAALPRLVNPKTGRIHTTYNQTVASTGRLSSIDPNLQNIPIRTALGRRVRKAFVPKGEGNIIFAADYSQVELRIMAFYSGDPTLTDAFKTGKDIHSATAATLFGIPIEDVDPDQRRIAKTVNFGIMYGLGAFGLAQRLGLSRKEAKNIIDNYFEKYPGIRNYIDDTIEETRKKGYSETLRGRRRYFELINSSNHNLRTGAERAAINMPIQGTASDIMKIAMINVDKAMQKRGFKSLMMLQVHDELVFEVVPEELDELREMVVSEMENALPIGEVPIVVDSGTGENWFEAH
jgi:DNA polymerase I